MSQENTTIIITPKNAVETVALLAELQDRGVSARLSLNAALDKVPTTQGPVLVTSEAIETHKWEAIFREAFTVIGLCPSARKMFKALMDNPDGLWTNELMKIIKTSPQGAVRNYRSVLRQAMERHGYVVSEDDRIISQTWDVSPAENHENFYQLWPNQLKALKNASGLYI